VQRVQLTSEETVQWHKLWQLPDTMFWGLWRN
jgi:hypothetical protein